MKNSKNIVNGKNGENLAEQYLIQKGYSILYKNWRYKHSEVDIIAKHNNTIVFIEVKYRKNSQFGYPEEFVNEHKIKKMHQAADAYIEQNQWEGELRFDIISIEAPDKVMHFEDAFY